MNTTHRVGLVRRLALTLLATVAALTGIVAATGQPAQAATYGSVTACFQSSATINGYTYWGPVQYGTVYVDVWNGSAWVARATTGTGSNGCVSHSVQTGYYWHLRMDHYTKPYRLVGTSPYALVQGPYNYNLGTTRVGTVRVG